MIRFRHDPPTGALYFRLREGEIAETLELPTPGAYVDIDEDGNIMGLEFLSLQEFLYSIDSAHGELGLPDRIEPGASLAPSDHAAELERDAFENWVELHWRRYLEQERTMRLEE